MEIHLLRVRACARQNTFEYTFMNSHITAGAIDDGHNFRQSFKLLSHVCATNQRIAFIALLRLEIKQKQPLAFIIFYCKICCSGTTVVANTAILIIICTFKAEERYKLCDHSVMNSLDRVPLCIMCFFIGYSLSRNANLFFPLLLAISLLFLKMFANRIKLIK